MRITEGYPRFFIAKNRSRAMTISNDEGMKSLVPILGEGHEEISAEEMQEIADYAMLNRVYANRAALEDGFSLGLRDMKGGLQNHRGKT